MTQQVNLFDPALRRQRDWLSLTNVVAGAALLSVAVGTAGFAVRSEIGGLNAQAAANETQLKAQRDQMTALGQQAANRKPDPRLEQEITSARALLAMRGEVLQVLQQRMGPQAALHAEYLRGFARQSVPGLWLTGITLNAENGDMEIAGRLVDPALLPEYIRRLNREPAFQGRAFSALQLAHAEETPAGQAASPEGKATTGNKKSFHAFKLIPRVEDKPVGQQQAAKLVQNPGGAG